MNEVHVADLIEASSKLLLATGASHHWNGWTKEALEKMEAALLNFGIKVTCSGCPVGVKEP